MYVRFGGIGLPRAEGANLDPTAFPADYRKRPALQQTDINNSGTLFIQMFQGLDTCFLQYEILVVTMKKEDGAPQCGNFTMRNPFSSTKPE
ncbi:MAG: hypothetical protein KJ011_11685 [Burkholderiaceae bacterium]|nr:hypothetical protein [Burkholderiaceae bacterium]